MSPMMMLTTLLALLSTVCCHSIGFGACPRLSGMKDFQPAKFAGFWYVIEMYSTYSRCVTLDFGRISKDDFRVVEGKEYALAQVMGVDHVFSNSGVYVSKAPKNTAKFEVKWSNSLFGAADGTIIKTDYEKFAVVLECQHIFYFMKRTSAAILSRSRDLDPKLLKTIKQELCRTFNLNIQNFETIPQDRCKKSPPELAKERLNKRNGERGIPGTIGGHPPHPKSSNTTKPLTTVSKNSSNTVSKRFVKPLPTSKSFRNSTSKPQVLRPALSTKTVSANAPQRNASLLRPQTMKSLPTKPAKATTAPKKTQSSKPPPSKPMTKKNGYFNTSSNTNTGRRSLSVSVKPQNSLSTGRKTNPPPRPPRPNIKSPKPQSPASGGRKTLPPRPPLPNHRSPKPGRPGLIGKKTPPPRPSPPSNNILKTKNPLSTKAPSASSAKAKRQSPGLTINRAQKP